MAAAERIRVEIACPDGADFRIVQVQLPAGTTARQALAALALTPSQDLALGLFGRLIDADMPLADGDRLELYLPLQVDPKTARRQRAAANAKKSGRR